MRFNHNFLIYDSRQSSPDRAGCLLADRMKSLSETMIAANIAALPRLGDLASRPPRYLTENVTCYNSPPFSNNPFNRR